MCNKITDYTTILLYDLTNMLILVYYNKSLECLPKIICFYYFEQNVSSEMQYLEYIPKENVTNSHGIIYKTMFIKYNLKISKYILRLTDFSMMLLDLRIA